MTQYISKDAIVAEIEKLKAEALQKKSQCKRSGLEKIMHQIGAYNKVLSFLDTLEEKEFQEKNLYVITRCEEHSDYVEKVFFSKKKAEEYCKQFEGDEDAYGRDITEIKVDCPPFEMKEMDLEKEFDNYAKDILACDVQFEPFTHLYNCAKYFYKLGLAQKGE